MKIKLNLQFFADGGAAGGAGTGGAAQGATAPMATGTESASGQQEGTDNLPHLQPRRRKENPLEHVQFGIQTESKRQETQESAPAKTPFKDLIKGEYAQEAQAWLGDAMASRFKAQGEMKQQLQAQQAIMDKMARKYGLKAGDMDGLSKALEDDESVYAQGAAEAGMPVNAFKELEQAKEQRDTLLAEKQAAQQEAAIRQHFGKLHAQGMELQKQFPGFNLLEEMKDPRFMQLTSPQIGLSVKDAYFAIHAEEIQRQSMQYAGQEAARNLASTVRAGAMRPLENGIQGGGAVQARTNVKELTRAERDEINRRARAGQIIRF